ncbi:MAG: dihydrolipoyl dehydrogenase [Chlamydiales bacterium]|nr:dihydrolipoyl dehydrogenase [Chlamydiales bacterium]
MFDLIVIGAGPGGYVAAICAAQKGMKVACIEKGETLGGTCLNVGCIPSKALLHSSEYYARIAKEGEEHGIIAESVRADLSRMMERKNGVVKGLTEGIAFLFKKNKVEWIKGSAAFVSPKAVSVEGKTHEAKNILIATGSEPIALPFLPFDEKYVVSSTGALELNKVPKKLLIVGAGVIGLELGSVYRRLGSAVEVVELLDRVIPPFDGALSKQAEQIFKKQGMKFHLSTKVVSGKVERGKVSLELENETLKGDVALISIGRKPYTKDLALDKAGISLNEKGQIPVDNAFRTAAPSVYAIGDVIDGPMLAHKASEEGIAVIDHLTGETSHLNYIAIPNVMYTWPEVAAVGMTEEEAKAHNLSLLVGTFSFRANPRARCSGDAEGIVKVIGEKKTGKLLGMHIIGPSASEMIGEGVLALEKGLTLKELAHASHAHPTCSEAIKEASLAALGKPLHS